MLFVLPFLIACGGGVSADAVTNSPTNSAGAKPPAAAPTPANSPEDIAKLAEGLKIADAADGAEDKVVHKCLGCALGMSGKAEHSLDVDGTTLHMCSVGCKTAVSKDVKARLIELAG
jgi:hypothetical protein